MLRKGKLHFCNFRPATSAGYLDGFRIHYRRRRTDRYESFETVTLRRPSADAFAIRRLTEGVEYEV